MKKPVNYRCSNCKSYHKEKWFDNNEKIPEYLKKDICPVCGGALKMFDFSNNGYRWRFCDKRTN